MWSLGAGILKDGMDKEKAEIVDRMIADHEPDEKIMRFCKVDADYIAEHKKALAAKELQTV